MKKKTVLILVVIILIQTITRVYFGFKKEYFHMDEIYSYGLMNYDKLNIADNYDFLNKWHDKSYYKDYIQINSNEKFNIKPVYENQKDDVHPPLYYLLLRISSSFSIDNFSKWTGILLNIVIFIVSSIFVFLIAKILFKNPIYALLTCLINGFTIISLNCSLYIRMYELCNLNILIITYLHLRIYNKEKLSIANILGISFFMILGGLTHYYYFIYVIALYMLYLVKSIKTKRYKNLIIYNIGVFMAAGVYLAIFPYAISHILFSYRGVFVEVSYIKNFFGYLLKINKDFFNYLLPFFILIIFIINLRKEDDNKNDIKENNKEETKIKKLKLDKRINLILIPILIYFIIVIAKAPYIETRYIMPIHSSLIIVIIYLSKFIINKNLDNKSTLFITTLLFLIIIYSPIITRTNLEFTYTKYNSIAKRIEERDLPIIYIFNTGENRILDDLYLFTLVDKSIVLDYNSLKENNYSKLIDVKNEINDFILICNNGVNEEIVKSVINGECQYMQRMNACNIYEVKGNEDNV